MVSLHCAWFRFEEEASARAARKAESEARKALWRAEEAQVREPTIISGGHSKQDLTLLVKTG